MGDLIVLLAMLPIGFLVIGGFGAFIIDAVDANRRRAAIRKALDSLRR